MFMGREKELLIACTTPVSLCLWCYMVVDALEKRR